MGVERAVTRWYVRRQGIWQEIEAQQARLAQVLQESGTALQRAEIEQRLREARQRLLKLGPCPRSMMG
jgi:hypothetical protein